MNKPIIYRAASNLCAVAIEALKLQRADRTLVPVAEALEVMQAEPLNFELVHQGWSISALEPLRQLIGQSSYRLGAFMTEAPHIFDCSSLMKWFFARYGINLPRLSIEQSTEGAKVVSHFPFRCGDLIFSRSRRKNGANFYLHDPNWGIGHVGLATGHGTMLHASSEQGVIEENIHDVVGSKLELLREVRRLIIDPEDFYVFRLPPEPIIESSASIRWRILMNLKSQEDSISQNV